VHGTDPRTQPSPADINEAVDGKKPGGTAVGRTVVVGVLDLVAGVCLVLVNVVVVLADMTGTDWAEPQAATVRAMTTTTDRVAKRRLSTTTPRTTVLGR
jgi:hypothetical protein